MSEIKAIEAGYQPAPRCEKCGLKLFHGVCPHGVDCEGPDPNDELREAGEYDTLENLGMCQDDFR